MSYLTSVYWAIFVARRIIFAACLVYAYDNPAPGLSAFFAFACANLCMLSFGVLWDQSWIAIQNAVNEYFLALLALVLIVLCNAF